MGKKRKLTENSELVRKMKKYGKKSISAVICLFLLGALCLSACGKSEGQEQSGSFAEGADGGLGGQSGDDGSSDEEMPDGGTSGGDALKEDAGTGTGENTGIGGSAGNTAEESVAAPSVCGKLSVKGHQLTDSSGNAVQLRGISTHGLAWFPQYVNEELFRELRREWKANVIRLAMYTAESGGYCTDGDKESLKELVKKGVEYAAAQDLYVIVDWHILSDNNPNQYKEEALSFFGEMSKALAGYENVLYEICNEPNGGTSWGEIKAYAEEVIPVIRANAPEAIILVGTPEWSQQVEKAAADPIAGYGNIMYTLHFYAATHTGALRNTMAEALEAGLPVFVSEYGICDASGNGGIDKVQAKAWVQLMDQYKVSYVAWNLSNKEETSAVIRSGVGKVSGFTEDDLSDTGRWLKSVLQRNVGQTGMRVPQDADRNGSTGTDMGDVQGISGGKLKSSEDKSGSPAKNSGEIHENSAGTVVCSGKSGGLEFTAALSGGWESGGRKFYQYTVTIKNGSRQACGSWSLDVAFSEDIALSDGWNGKYSVSGDTLRISSEDYNGQLAAGGSTGDVGFIVSSENGAVIQAIR